MTTSTSSASGRTATVAVDVWMRLPAGEDRLLGRGQPAQFWVRFAGKRLRLLELAGDPPVVLVGGDDLGEAGMFARHLLIPPRIAENRWIGQGTGQFLVTGLQRCETGQHFRAHSSLLRIAYTNDYSIRRRDGPALRPAGGDGASDGVRPECRTSSQTSGLATRSRRTFADRCRTDGISSRSPPGCSRGSIRS